MFIVAANIDKEKDTTGDGDMYGFQDTGTDGDTNGVEHCEAAAEFVESVSSSQSKDQSAMPATKDNHTGTICTFKQTTFNIYILYILYILILLQMKFLLFLRNV